MSIKFKIITRRNPLDSTAPVKYYATVDRNQTVTTNVLAKEIAARSTVSRADILAVLASFSEVIIEHLKNSDAVKLNDIGTFYPTIASKGVANEGDFNAKTHIKGAKIRFLPAKSLIYEIEDVDFKRS